MQIGKRFFALHICEGVANYPELKKMILLREETLRKMDPTMGGVPVVFDLNHLTREEGEEIARAEKKGANIEGIVNKSFFNEWDGRHWCEIQVWDEKALAAIDQGIGVSNAYIIKSKAPGGEYHAVKYDEEVMDGEYDHLLITASPRYEEAKILTPTQFEEYNEKRKAQLALVTNSKESSMSLKFWERKESETIKKLDGIEVELPKSKKVVMITNVLNAVDEQMAKEESGEQMANMEHKVKLHDNTMCNVGELVEKHKMAMEHNERMKNKLEEHGIDIEDITNAEGHEGESEEEKLAREKAENDKKALDEAKALEEHEKKELAENKKRQEILLKNQKLAKAKANGALDIEKARILNAKKRDGDSQYVQPVIKSKEDFIKKD